MKIELDSIILHPADEKHIAVGSEAWSMYDLLAPGFREISERRKDWIESINKYISDRLNPTDQLLDVGAGDGIRARTIADAAGIREIVLVEPSVEMSKLARSVPNSEIFIKSAENLSEIRDYKSFDAILCLWNVLGHIPTFERRIIAALNMAELLNDNGVIYIDVNNRYNLKAYGSKAIENINIDISNPDGLTGVNGDVVYEISYGNQSIPASGHVFTLKELELIVHAAGTQVDTVAYFDYDTGMSVNNQFEGQILMTLRKSNLSLGKDDDLATQVPT